MDSTESQLRFGASLTTASDPAHPHHPLYHGSGKQYCTVTYRKDDIRVLFRY